ncbi:MAG: hypothetical protein DMG21_00905 [Acidobacteria bacterium]|nr:MAG: hypothetical protein DMG21_00905 [Acidobacteriota bacterium]
MSCSNSSAAACANGGLGYQTMDNIALEAQNVGKTWKSYGECMPYVGYTGGSTTCPNNGPRYIDYHVPLSYFTNINTAQDLVPFEDPNVGFAHDLTSGTLPNFSYVTPNGCHTGRDATYNSGNSSCFTDHRCSAMTTIAAELCTADNWVSANIKPLVQSSYLQAGGDGLLIISFDEDLQCGGHLATVLVSSKLRSAGVESSRLYQNENVLRAMAEGLGLRTTGLGAAAWANNMADFFSAPAPITLTDQNWGACKSNCSSSPSAIASGKFAVSQGQLIVAFCGIYNVATTTPPLVTDTAGNNFFQVGLNQVNGSGSDSMAMFYAKNAIASLSDAVTCNWGSASSTILSVTAHAYSGADPVAPLDAIASGTARGLTSIQTAPFSTSSANEIIVAGMMSGSSCITPPSPGSGYAMEIDVLPSGCSSAVAAAEDAVVTSQRSNITASMTFSSNTWADMIVAISRSARRAQHRPSRSAIPRARC